jgi:superfamily II DNA helicase RecQ
VLVATDLGARGLDFPDVDLVVLYEPPLLASEYLHRVGRTGRANRKGLAVTLVGRKDSNQADVIRTELARSADGVDDEFRGVLSSKSRHAIDRQVTAASNLYYCSTLLSLACRAHWCAPLLCFSLVSLALSTHAACTRAGCCRARSGTATSFSCHHRT